ncbi:MAG: transcriptional repressor [Anaerohalosphaeraceae bacterium]|nr:transcriptional repressor [Anaerohalosphaeraceae bacterium]
MDETFLRHKMADTEFDKKMASFFLRCKEQGLKVTPQRTEVYKALLTSKDHPSAEVVYGRVRGVLPNISLDTVNRTLIMLSKIGAAFIVEGSGDVKRFDGNLDGHQHFKCVKCKRIIDFRHKPFDNVDVPEGLGENVKVLRMCVYAEGICENCIAND